MHNTVYIKKVTSIMQIPCVITEQYPKAFGRTVSELLQQPQEQQRIDEDNSAHHQIVFEKRQFSMLTDDVATVLQQSGRKQVILCGIEAHVCVLQSTLDLIGAGYDVFIVADAVSSQRPYDRTVALHRLKDSGAVMTTSESLVFELMGSSEHPNFKEISSITVAHNRDHASGFADRHVL